MKWIRPALDHLSEHGEGGFDLLRLTRFLLGRLHEEVHCDSPLCDIGVKDGTSGSTNDAALNVTTRKLEHLTQSKILIN